MSYKFDRNRVNNKKVIGFEDLEIAFMGPAILNI